MQSFTLAWQTAASRSEMGKFVDFLYPNSPLSSLLDCGAHIATQAWMILRPPSHRSLTRSSIAFSRDTAS